MRRRQAVWPGWFPTLAALLSVGLAAAGCGESRQIVGAGDSLEDFAGHLEERIAEQMDAYDVPGLAIALIREGSLVWSDAYGYADVETGRPMTVDTISRTESISKPVTAWGVMHLVQEGELELSDRVVDLVDDWSFPETAYAEEDVTVGQLLDHTSGLPLGVIADHYPPQSNMPTLEEKLTEEARLLLEPGSRFLYSNVGFNLLELVIEDTTGQDFADFMQREVLLPLGMEHSSFEWSEGTATPIPTGYDLDGEPVPVYVYPEKASGGLLAPVEDIARFVAAGTTGPYHVDTGVLDQDSIDALHTPTVDVTGIYQFVTDSYGLGHFVEDLSGATAVWHGGQGDGWMTHFHSIPERGDGIVILTNSQRSWPMISALLEDWSNWIGGSAVGMSLIVDASRWLSVASGLMLAVALLMLIGAGRGLLSRGLRFAPATIRFSVGRMIQALLGVIVLAMVVVALTTDIWSFFLIPLFPTVSGWLATALVSLAVALLLAASTEPLPAASGS